MDTIYCPNHDEWIVYDADEHAELASEGCEPQPAELTFNLEGWRGHYLTADFLSLAADLLESCQLDCATYHLDDPVNFPLRDQVDKLKNEANEAWATYHAHNHLHPRPDQVEDYGTDCNDDCSCEFIGEVADDMESLLGDLGFVTEWNDGVSVYKVGSR